jgi:predicted small lipoprotein YifL
MDVFVEETAAFAVPSIAGCGGKCPKGRAHEARA